MVDWCLAAQGAIESYATLLWYWGLYYGHVFLSCHLGLLFVRHVRYDEWLDDELKDDGVVLDSWLIHVWPLLHGCASLFPVPILAGCFQRMHHWCSAFCVLFLAFPS